VRKREHVPLVLAQDQLGLVEQSGQVVLDPVREPAERRRPVPFTWMR
jgi:hypothetical protein